MASSGSFRERRSPSRHFLPPDPRTTEPYRFTPQLALRVGVLAALALIIFAVLFLRLWALQVLSGDRYLNAAQNNQLRTVPVEAPRGSILDRAGNTIVSNVPGTAVQIWTADLPKEGRYAMLQRLSKVLRVPLPRLTKALEEGKGDPLTPILVKTAVHEDQVATLLERPHEFPGVSVVGTYLRDYENRALGAQVLGYVGEISEEELARLEGDGYRGGEKIGKTGVEAAFDTYLRGRAGAAQLRVDSLGRPLGTFTERRPAQPGNNVRLTLDVGLQRAAERALRYGIDLAYENEEWNANGGAIVALDPRDGAVLAMASNPTYKPSVYVGRVDPKKLEPLIDDEVAKKRNYPGINRAIAGVYPPGSTFKPLTALAAISDGLLSPYEYIQCTPYAEYGLDKFRFDNWNPFTNAPMSLTTALSQSCDTYFYDLGNRYYVRGEHERPYWTKMQGLGEEVRLRPAGGPRHRRRGSRPAADAGLAEAGRPHRLGQGLEPGRPDPARDRPEGHERDAAADGPFLRGARERRQSRDAVHRLLDRAARQRRLAARAAVHVPVRTRRPRSTSTHSGSASCARASTRRRTTPKAPPRASSAASRCRSRARPGPRRRSSTCPATRSGISRISRGGAAGGRSTGTST